MYLSDLLDILNGDEKPDLSRLQMLSIFRNDKPLNDTERIDLFHRLGLSDREGEHLTQEEIARLSGVSRETVAQYYTGRLKLSP